MVHCKVRGKGEVCACGLPEFFGSIMVQERGRSASRLNAGFLTQWFYFKEVP